MAKYKVIVGLSYSGKRAEPGDIVDDIPTRSIKWLKDQGIIESVASKPKAETEEDTPAPPVLDSEVTESDDGSVDDTEED
jgi:hypothetical protein